MICMEPAFVGSISATCQASPKHAMHEPADVAGSGCLARTSGGVDLPLGINTGVVSHAIEALAKQPIAPTLVILNSIVIPCLRRQVHAVGRADPFGSDAFGAFRLDDAVRDAPPGEAKRRTVRHFGQRFDWLRPDQQAGRPGRQAGHICPRLRG